MDFHVNGIWRSLTWGCASAGRPSIQLELSDSQLISVEKDNITRTVSFEALIDRVNVTLEALKIIQIHSARFNDEGELKSLGDPLVYDDIYPFVTHLLENLEYSVILHLNNNTDISMLDPRANVVLVPTVPSMGAADNNYWANLYYLTDEGEILFLCTSDIDYKWIKEQIMRYQLSERFMVHLSVVNKPNVIKKWADRIIVDSLGIHLLPFQPYVRVPLSADKTKKYT